MFWEATDAEKAKVIELWECHIPSAIIAVKTKLSQERVRKIINNHARENSKICTQNKQASAGFNGNEIRSLYRDFYR